MDPTAGEMKLFYSSANGDRWYLSKAIDSGARFVRHEPNRSSGGLVSTTSVEDFLARDGQGPQHDELRRLLA
jgi:hypothetical protein